jgi:hypothetical protein
MTDGITHCSLACSALACLRMGTSGSVSRFDPEAKKVVKQVLDSMILQQEGPVGRHLLRERAQLEVYRSSLSRPVCHPPEDER